MPVASAYPEEPDNLLEALRGASIDEEKVQPTKNGLTEACASLLIGFQVSNQNIGKYYHIYSSP